MQFLRGFIHLRVEQPTRKIVTLKHARMERKVFSFKIQQTPWIMNKYLFLLVFDAVDSFSFKIQQTPWIMNKYLFLLVFDAVDIFQSNIGTLPQLRMFFEL